MTNNPLGNRDLIRAINRSTILNAIKTHGAIPRAEIARFTGLSPATVTGITADLIQNDLVFEKLHWLSPVGKPYVSDHLGGACCFVSFSDTFMCFYVVGYMVILH